MTKRKYITLEEVLREQLKDPEFKREWDKPDPEIEILRALLLLRQKTGLSQRALAKKMHASQAEIARLERGHNATIKTLQRVAKATGTTLKIEFV